MPSVLLCTALVNALSLAMATSAAAGRQVAVEFDTSLVKEMTKAR